MALSTDDQKLKDLALGAMPWWFGGDRFQEELDAFATIMGLARDQLDYWYDNSFIGDAAGPTGDLPDWLEQHARDRGTSRQPSETDVALRQRLKNYPDALTRQALLDAAQAIVDADSISGTVYITEIPRASIHGNTHPSHEYSDGGVISGTAPNMKFTPNTNPGRAILSAHTPLGFWASTYVHFSTGYDANNQGPFEITGHDGDSYEFTNASGVAETVGGGSTWFFQKRDRRGNNLRGFATCYGGRGYRFGANRAGFVMMLPYGSTAATEAAVREMLRQKKAAGIFYLVERRTSP